MKGIPRKITIEPVLNGFIVEVGCQRVVFDNVGKLGTAVIQYYSDPDKVEKEYRDKAVNNTLDRPCDPTPRTPPILHVREPASQVEQRYAELNRRVAEQGLAAGTGDMIASLTTPPTQGSGSVTTPANP